MAMMPTKSPVLVARDGLLVRLDEVIGDMRREGPAVLLISGEAGVGKSRLVEELTSKATARGVRVLIGRCLEFGEEIWPLAPLREVVTALVDQLDEEALELVLGAARRELARLVPDLGDPASAPLASARLCELVLGVVKRLARRGPVLLVMEDLHWADPSTRALFSLLSRADALGPVLVVGTYRSDELNRRHPLRRVLAELFRGVRPERVELERLDRAGTAELVEKICGVVPEPTLVDSIHGRSGGNPFFVEELAAALRESPAAQADPLAFLEADRLPATDRKSVV